MTFQFQQDQLQTQTEQIDFHKIETKLSGLTGRNVQIRRNLHCKTPNTRKQYCHDQQNMTGVLGGGLQIAIAIMSPSKIPQ